MGGGSSSLVHGFTRSPGTTGGHTTKSVKARSSIKGCGAGSGPAVGSWTPLQYRTPSVQDGALGIFCMFLCYKQARDEFQARLHLENTPPQPSAPVTPPQHGANH